MVELPGPAAIVAGRRAVLPADCAAAGGWFGRFSGRRRKRWRGESGGGHWGWSRGRRHRSHNWFVGEVVGPCSLLLTGERDI